MAGQTGAGARLVLLVTAPTVRAGLLSWPAWQTLAGASRVLAPAADHPLLPALDEAGIGWELLPGDAVDGQAAGEQAGDARAGDGPAGGGPADPAAVARRLTQAVAGTAGTVVWLCSPDPPGQPANGDPGTAGPGRRAGRTGGPG